MESPVTECILVLGLILKEEPGLPKAQGCGAAHSIHYPWWPPGCDENVYCLKLRSRCCTEPLYPLHTVSLPFLLAGMVEYLHTAGGVIREAVEIGFRRVEIFPPHSESPIVKHLAFVLRPATMPKWVGTISLCKSTISDHYLAGVYHQLWALATRMQRRTYTYWGQRRLIPAAGATARQSGWMACRACICWQ